MFLSLFLISREAYPDVFESKAEQTPLIELYSSEGCSSCPPADEWLGTLQSKTGLWKSFIPVNFHVGYWDYLGWKDRFAKEEYVERQNRYAALWKQTSIYTPAIVFNGKASNGWRFGMLPSLTKLTPGILKVIVQKTGEGNIQFLPNLKNSNYTAHVALLGFDVRSNIMAGENHGRILQHQFLVISHQKIQLNPEKNFESSFQLNRVSEVSRQAIAVWVEAPESPVPLQSVGGFLTQSLQ